MQPPAFKFQSISTGSRNSFTPLSASVALQDQLIVSRRVTDSERAFFRWVVLFESQNVGHGTMGPAQSHRDSPGNPFGMSMRAIPSISGPESVLEFASRTIEFKEKGKLLVIALEFRIVPHYDVKRPLFLTSLTAVHRSHPSTSSSCTDSPSLTLSSFSTPGCKAFQQLTVHVQNQTLHHKSPTRNVKTALLILTSLSLRCDTSSEVEATCCLLHCLNKCEGSAESADSSTSYKSPTAVPSTNRGSIRVSGCRPGWQCQLSPHPSSSSPVSS